MDAGTLRRIAANGSATNLATGLTGVRYMTIDTTGDLYLLDVDAATIRRVTQGGAVSIAFSGLPLNDQSRGLARDTASNVYVADTQNHTIRRVTPAGTVTTVAGAVLQPGRAN